MADSAFFGLPAELQRSLAPALLACREAGQVGALLERLAEALGASGGVVWRREAALVAEAVCGCVRREWAETYGPKAAGAVAAQECASGIFDPSAGAYHPSRSGASLVQVAAIALPAAGGCAGSVELWWTEGRAPYPVADVLPGLEAALSAVLPGVFTQEAERREYLTAISRLMMLYDIGKVFHSTLEPAELAPLILARAQSILEADAAAVWFLDPVKKNLYCAAAAGEGAGALHSARVWASDAGLGAAVGAGEAVLLQDVEDAAWTSRWQSERLASLMAVPLLHSGSLLGALEVVRGAGRRFTEDDLTVLIDVAKQAATSLRNAQRHQAERRVKEMNALMEISQEISSTLDLDRVISTTVNRITSVIPTDRCSLSVLRKGKWELAAISGEMKVDRGAPGVRDLEALHTWLAGAESDVIVTQTEEGIDHDREEVRGKFAAYFRQSGMRAFTGLLLRDAEGAVGVLALEARDPAALTPGHNDLARIFANQVTVALRNALLYQQVPLIGVLQPLVERQARFAALPKARRTLLVAGAGAAVLFLALFPMHAKPGGAARVLPAQIVPVSAEVEGVVRRVLVSEGDYVEPGQVLAEMSADQHRVAIEQAQAEQEIVSRRIFQYEARGELGAARIERARLQQVNAQLDLHRTRAAQTRLRSPLRGTVITPRLEERVGQYLNRGDVLLQVVDAGRAWVEIAVPEVEVPQVQPGQTAWLKLNAFPARRFEGRVVRISPQGREEAKARVFDVVVEVDNSEQLLRAGMLGRGKVLAERHSVGYLLLRPPLRWIWLKVWNWLP